MNSYQRKLCWAGGRLFAALLVICGVLAFRVHASRSVEAQQEQLAAEEIAHLARAEQVRREKDQLEAQKQERIEQIARFMARWQDQIQYNLHEAQRDLEMEENRRQTANDLFNGTITPMRALSPPYVSQEETLYVGLLNKYRITPAKASLPNLNEIYHRLQVSFERGDKQPPHI